ncbi:hypothetical protein [Novosphingobium mangrovi (ex Huang et al. 2023)]|uniref:Alg9-like mannosyltransferase family protein n=1 Tax=Novosphingobium mangrovi (ex Huang et al. 2023) TaxID=2976432 RepID=A0ABT2I384_9SPHN|nr:hypothetical protein [Novosphingobium mangrovi (ex Huang et al. 2023)]MCT2399261.1 hypothetical protein [Novosphingobium mangrovi (ex Huang et al. 2023)]
MLAGLILRVAGFSLYDIGYSDELMQYLEQANRLVTGHGIVPWESREGLRNALIPQLLVPAAALGHWLAPGTLLHVGLVRAWFLALTLIALPGAWKLGVLHSRAAGLVALTVVAVWWESVLFSEFMLSESLGAALMLGGAALLLDSRSSRRRLAIAGLLIGFAVLVRLQYAVFAGVLVIAALRLDWQRWGPVVLGGLCALALGALSDLAGGLVPFSWAVVTVKMNLGDGIAARFGTLPADAYLQMLVRHLFPFALPIGLGALFAGARYRPLLLAALANLLVHSLIAHKEYRFVWLTVLSLLVLAALASVRIAEYYAARRGSAGPLTLPAVLVICGAWAMASAWSSHVTGGAGAYRGGGAVAQMADSAARDPAICGVAVPFEYKSHVVTALLANPKPLALIPEGVMDGKASLPFGVVTSANALLLRRDAQVPAGYHRIACAEGRDFPCLFEREGQCRPDPRYSYQQMIARAGL